MVANLDLPDPSPDNDVWGEELNAAITAINTDVESNKTAVSGVVTGLASKADSSAVTTALANKADVAVVNGELASINTALMGKADASSVDGKADAATVNAEFVAVNAALDGKADISDLDGKADAATVDSQISSINTALSGKADVSALDAKADASTVNAEIASINTALDGKADISDLDSKADVSALNAKADAATVDSALSAINTTLDAKADTTTVNASISALNTELDSKANTSDMTSALAAKANEADVAASFSDVEASIATKADSSALTALSSTVDTKASTSYVDSELANKVDVADIPPTPLILRQGEMVPAGTKAGTVIYRIPKPGENVKVTHLSNNKSEPITAFELPDDLAIGDVLMAIATTQGAGRSFTWDSAWTELMDMSQQRTTSVAIYRIADQAALDAVATPVITPSGNFDSMVLAILKIDARSQTAWEAYGSGNGRSGNTLSSPSNTGFGITAISSSPFAAFDKEWVFAVAYSGIPAGPAPEITLPVQYETIIDTSTGGLSFKMGRRFSDVLPVAALSIGVQHVPGFENANYGGGHFITPIKEG